MHSVIRSSLSGLLNELFLVITSAAGVQLNDKFGVLLKRRCKRCSLHGLGFKFFKSEFILKIKKNSWLRRDIMIGHQTTSGFLCGSDFIFLWPPLIELIELCKYHFQQRWIQSFTVCWINVARPSNPVWFSLPDTSEQTSGQSGRVQDQHGGTREAEHQLQLQPFPVF